MNARHDACTALTDIGQSGYPQEHMPLPDPKMGAASSAPTVFILYGAGRGMGSDPKIG